MMSDYVTRGFRVQLTTAMDSILRTAVSEISKIFENNLHDYHTELARKGEEIEQLKVQLQTTELKPRESEDGIDKTAEVEKSQSYETQGVTEDALIAFNETSQVPEMHVEVPDDWCAPLGCESLTNKEEVICPSIRLRRLSIPLWHIPLIKTEEDMESKTGMQSETGSSSHKKTQNSSQQKHALRSRHQLARNNMKDVIQDTKLEYSGKDLTTNKQVHVTRGGGKSKQQLKVVRVKRKYSCKYCIKVFDTEFGRSVHTRSHKKCRGCKREFPFPSSLKIHMARCRKLKMKAALSTEPQIPVCDKEKWNTPKQDHVIEDESAPSTDLDSTSSTKKNGSTKMFSCVHCNKTFHHNCHLREHERIHTGEKPFPCSMCPKKFRINQALKNHLMRRHKYQLNSKESKQDLAWTEPLEEPEDNSEEDLNFPSKYSPGGANCNTNSRKVKGPRWQTMGVRCFNGFSCSLCKKLLMNKYKLIEHFRLHTGEKPISCQWCQKRFRTIGLLQAHERRKHSRKNITCRQCGLDFPTQRVLARHMFDFHKDCESQIRKNICQVCGKFFLTEGRLINHVDRMHT